MTIKRLDYQTFMEQEYPEIYEESKKKFDTIIHQNKLDYIKNYKKMLIICDVCGHSYKRSYKKAHEKSRKHIQTQYNFKKDIE